MQNSSSPFVAALFAEEVAPPAPEGGAKGGGRKGKGSKSDKATVGAQFIQQLGSLMRTINSTGVHCASLDWGSNRARTGEQPRAAPFRRLTRAGAASAQPGLRRASA